MLPTQLLWQLATSGNLLIPSLVPSGPQMFLATPRPTPRRLSGDVLDRKIMWQRPTFSSHPRSRCSLRKRACLWLSRGRCFLCETEIRAPFQTAKRNDRLSGLQMCEKQHQKKRKPPSWKGQRIHTRGRVFQNVPFRDRRWSSVGTLSRLFSVIISWMCRMNMQWSQGEGFGLENESLKKKTTKKRPESGCIFQLPASPPPSQSLFYKSVSSLHSRTDTATPSTLIACYSPLKITTCSSPWLRSTFHF